MVEYVPEPVAETEPDTGVSDAAEGADGAAILAEGVSPKGSEEQLLEFGEDGSEAGWWSNLKVGIRT